MLDESGAALSPEIIQSSLIEIVRQNDENDPPVGALTSLPRDEWASVRTVFIRSVSCRSRVGLVSVYGVASRQCNHRSVA